QDHIADVGAVGQHHHQAVDPDAAAAGGGHAVFQGAHVVRVVVHGFFVAGILGGHLGTEPGSLVFRVVQFGKAVGDLAPAGKQLEAFRDAGLGVGRAGQGRDLDRVVD